MRVRSILLALRRNAASQEGVALMEVVMSAAVLVLVVLGVLAAMDAVSGTAGANQARTVAAALAEEDQERLRGLATEDLEEIAKDPPNPRQVLVGNVTYTVASEARWVTDAAGEDASCALESGEGSYLRIRTRVTSPITGEAVKPVELTSIVAPRPGSGTLAALVKNAAGQPLSGVNVAIAGPEAADPEPTNDVGCAVFTGLDAGTYNVTLNQSPWIGEDGKQLTTKTATVTAGNVATVEFVYDRGSSLNAQVYTIKNGVEVDDTSWGVIAANSKVPAGFRQADPQPPATAQSFTFASMFPFTNPYTIYAGKCLGSDPSKLIPTYFDTNPNLVVTLAPGVPGGTVRVLEPAVDAHVTRSGDRSGARVYAYPLPRENLPDVVAECGGRVELTSFSSTTQTNGKLHSTRVTGLPFGKYDFCATWIDTAPSPDRTYTATVTNVSNMTPTGMTVEIPLPTTQSSGGCPSK